jgi:hypothetical protein
MSYALPEVMRGRFFCGLNAGNSQSARIRKSGVDPEPGTRREIVPAPPDLNLLDARQDIMCMAGLNRNQSVEHTFRA